MVETFQSLMKYLRNYMHSKYGDRFSAFWLRSNVVSNYGELRDQY